ncbi:TPA: dipeptide ABC transporter ATP-binding protein [Klebsiella pneumoniae]|nr:dipeptide ABC transporter ATP-binding protein [Klebsiella pneumoniae]
MSQTHETDTCEVLVVRNLNVAFRQQDAPEVQAVRQLSFSLRRGETLAIVGESGSGKSVTALALMRLLDAASSEVNSEGLWLRRRNRQVIALNEQTDAEMRRVRGADLAMIFQEPMTSLNPVFTIGEQIAESLRLHQGLGREEALRAAKKMLDQVRIPQAEEMLSRYPHQLSGGMRQRVMIAMALSCRPAVLIADEPTTALDVTIQAQILQLIAVLQKEMAMGVIFITHDMGVVADIADRVLVMYRGEAVETGSVEEIFRSPQHPYTQSLLAAVPRLGEMRGQDLPRRFPLPGQPLAESETPDTVVAGEPILQVRDLVARFPVRGGLLNRVTREVHAVEKVSFDLWPGETLSLVGESGCGKSTTGRALLRLVETQGGTITFDGQRIDTLAGGQRQRICIARALALNPKVVIADESVSALDVSIRAQIINLMLDLQREMGIAFLFISHDMAVVERISHRVAVMYRGRIVEIGPRRAVFENPQHPYTRKLMAAVPVADPGHRHPQRVLLSDDVPGNIYKRGEEIASVPLQQVGPGHFVARESADVLGRT